MKKLLVTTFIITSTLVACKTSQKTTASATPAPAATPANGTVTVTYEKDIKPIMEMHCVRCHNENEKAGYNLGILSGVKKGAMNGELMGTIKHLENFDPMPAYADMLDNTTIAKIETWIKEGMH